MAVQLGHYELLNIPEIPQRLQGVDEGIFLVYGAYKAQLTVLMFVAFSLPGALAATAVSLFSDAVYMTHGNFETPLERMAYRTALLATSLFLATSAIVFFSAGASLSFSATLLPVAVFTLGPTFLAGWFRALFNDRLGDLIGDVFQ